MCGIAGLISRVIAPEEAARIASRMGATLSHSGPDGTGQYLEECDGAVVALSHTRLAIVDLQDEAAQPVELADRSLVLVYNGEIYNYRSLVTTQVRELADAAERSDTVALAALLAVNGPSVVSDLRGIFAFAAWDRSRKRLWLARDHLGVKPLYVYEGDGFVLFASEVRAILASGLVPRRVSHAGVLSHLVFGAPIEPLTMVDGVRALPPGSLLEIDCDVNCRSTHWWTLSAAVRVAQEQAFSDRQLGIEVSRAVREQLMADVEVGLFLSGGIDSTAIALACERTGAFPRAITLGFEGDETVDSVLATITAAKLGMKSHLKVFKRSDLIFELDAWLACQDQPSVDGLNVFLVSKAAKELGIRVVLSGIGGDEVFGGYRGFRRARAAGLVAALAKWTGLAPLIRHLPASGERDRRWPRLIELLGGSMPSYFATRSLRGVASTRDALGPEWSNLDPIPAAAWDECRANHDRMPMQSAIALDESAFYLRNVLLRDADQMGMAHSVEIRVPLLDVRLASLSIAGLAHGRGRGAHGKGALLRAMSNSWLNTIAGQSKRGFEVPLRKWMRSDETIRYLRTLIGNDTGDSGGPLMSLAHRSIDGLATGRESAFQALSYVSAVRWMRANGLTDDT
jgi:asparagine synthase (glutamine-hydrolysing)